MKKNLLKLKTLILQIEEAKKISFDENVLRSINDKIILNQSKEDELQKEYIKVMANLSTFGLKKQETEQDLYW